ncbi:MAG: EscU/YscU/HrcU family type III secretion system export apparatus switch protein [Phycisphaerales bacterium]|jgi:flagellar biosynthetic protein FlhB|nr:EscU/YscU/HrcU family type III secretion system export apparatus switch protein [Phycisphaerales bacterium]MDP6987431.1 EscU/YscU/HrcU family type III secretion system export apparatus switch protein [Phycisphaerales bacterium]
MTRDAHERTEQPTLRRLQRARREGQVARSGDLSSSLLMLFACGAAWWWLPRGLVAAEDIVRGGLSRAGGDLQTMLSDAMWMVLLAIAIPATALFLMSALAGFLQVGGLFSSNPVTMDPARLDIAAGARRMLGPRGMMRLMFSLAKLLLVVAAGGLVLWGQREELLLLGQEGSIIDGVGQFGAMAVRALAASIATAVALGLLEFAWQHYAWRVDHRMTRQELLEERREVEGSSVFRRRQRGDVDRRVATPSILFVGEGVAVAVRWDATTMAVPVLTHGATGDNAMKLRAESSNLPEHRLPGLARDILESTEVGGGIPPRLHVAIAAAITASRHTA